MVQSKREDSVFVGRDVYTPLSSMVRDAPLGEAAIGHDVLVLCLHEAAQRTIFRACEVAKKQKQKNNQN